MDALQAEDDIEMSVLSNILLFCNQLTFDLILSHRDIFRLGIHPYRFYYTYWHLCQLLPHFVIRSFFHYMDCQLCNCFTMGCPPVRKIIHSLNPPCRRPKRMHSNENITTLKAYIIKASTTLHFTWHLVTNLFLHYIPNVLYGIYVSQIIWSF